MYGVILVLFFNFLYLMTKKTLVDIQTLVDRWIITDKQYKEALSLSQEDSESDSHRSFQTIISVFGGLMVSAWILLRVSLNWDNISDIRKTLLLVVSMILVYLWAWYRSRFHNDVLSAALWVIAVALLWANIFLQAQIYNLGWQLYAAFGWWLLGTLPLVYMTKMRTLFVTSLILFVTWYVSLLGHYDLYEWDWSFWWILATIAGLGFAFVSYSMIHRESWGKWLWMIAYRLGQFALIATIPFLFVHDLYSSSFWYGSDNGLAYRWLLTLLPVLSLISIIVWKIYHSLRLSLIWSLWWGIHTLFLILLAFFPDVFPWSLYRIGMVYGLCATWYVLWKWTILHDKRLTSLWGLSLWFFIWIIYIDYFTDAWAIGLVIGWILMILVWYGIARMQSLPSSWENQ